MKQQQLLLLAAVTATAFGSITVITEAHQKVDCHNPWEVPTYKGPPADDYYHPRWPVHTTPPPVKTAAPWKPAPWTPAPTARKPTPAPTSQQTTDTPATTQPTDAPTTVKPTDAPTTVKPTDAPTTVKATD